MSENENLDTRYLEMEVYLHTLKFYADGNEDGGLLARHVLFGPDDLLDRYRKALEFYADSRNWMERMTGAKAGNQMYGEGVIVPWSHADEGQMAREALDLKMDHKKAEVGDAPDDATLEHLLTRMVGG